MQHLDTESQKYQGNYLKNLSPRDSHLDPVSLRGVTPGHSDPDAESKEKDKFNLLAPIDKLDNRLLVVG